MDEGAKPGAETARTATFELERRRGKNLKLTFNARLLRMDGSDDAVLRGGLGTHFRSDELFSGRTSR